MASGRVGRSANCSDIATPFLTSSDPQQSQNKDLVEALTSSQNAADVCNRVPLGGEDACFGSGREFIGSARRQAGAVAGSDFGDEDAVVHDVGDVSAVGAPGERGGDVPGVGGDLHWLATIGRHRPKL